MDETNIISQYRSIFRNHSGDFLIAIMSRAHHILPTTAVCISMLVLFSISPIVLAWKGDKLSPWVGTTIYGKKCVGDQVPFGPYDYLQRASLQGQLEVVEESHFGQSVERLEKGQTTTAIGDIHYTLSAWPNHHRALNSALKYRLQNMADWPEDVRVPPAECYLQRAINFSPNDAKPYIMYGLLMHKATQYDKALSAYQTATRLLPNDIITQYNMGLTLVELKKYEEAKTVAEKVYSAGFPLPGLKKKLIAAGHWKNAPGVVEPKAAPQAEAAKVEPVPATTIPLEEVTKEMATPENLTP
jgi:tetratricopeptide (TPR) repeat protein